MFAFGDLGGIIYYSSLFMNIPYFIPLQRVLISLGKYVSLNMLKYDFIFLYLEVY